MNICQIMNFKLYIIYNKHEKINTGDQAREKSEVLLQVLE